jgi:hypothetical protein
MELAKGKLPNGKVLVSEDQPARPSQGSECGRWGAHGSYGLGRRSTTAGEPRSSSTAAAMLGFKQRPSPVPARVRRRCRDSDNYGYRRDHDGLLRRRFLEVLFDGKSGGCVDLSKPLRISRPSQAKFGNAPPWLVPPGREGGRGRLLLVNQSPVGRTAVFRRQGSSVVFDSERASSSGFRKNVTADFLHDRRSGWSGL